MGAFRESEFSGLPLESLAERVDGGREDAGFSAEGNGSGEKRGLVQVGEVVNQLAIEFTKPVQVPSASTQCGVLLRAFQRGERLTVAEALSRYGVYALSQRVGELKRAGWPIKSEPFKTPNGATVSRYFMDTERERMAA